MSEKDLKSNDELKKEIKRLRNQVESMSRKGKRFKQLKSGVLNFGTSFFIGKNLKDSFYNFYTEFPDKISKETLSDLSANIIIRLTKIGLFAIIFAMIPYLLLIKQNSLINTQNKLFNKQTELIEAERRSALVFLMSNIFDKVDDELKSNKDGSRKLGSPLIARIIALSQSLKPYRYLENNELIKRPLSPERGHLLIALSNTNLDTITIDKIIKSTDFRQAELRNANLENTVLRGIDLGGADLRDANLEKVNLSGAIIEYDTLSSLKFTKQKQSNLTNALLQKASCRYADLRSVCFNSANLTHTDLSQTVLEGAQFGNAILRGANFYRANITGMSLENTLVGNIDWIKNLKDQETIGYEKIEETYFVNKNPIFIGADKYYRIVKKKSIQNN